MRFLSPAVLLASCSSSGPVAVSHPVAGARCDVSGGIAFVAGAIRNDGTGWQAIADEDHSPLNIKSVTTREGMIVVEYTFKADKVVSLVVAPDESLARAGYSAGASVGLTEARISLANNGGVDPWGVSTEEIPWSNLWVQGMFNARCSDEVQSAGHALSRKLAPASPIASDPAASK